MRAYSLLTLLVLGRLGFAPSTAAQAARDTAVEAMDELELIFRREVFVYPAAGRRDPFAPLTGAGFSARFDALVLKGVIHSSAPGRSVALLVDGTGRIHRVRRGDRVGNARVTDISPRSVRFAIQGFGAIRQARLELKSKGREGGER